MHLLALLNVFLIALPILEGNESVNIAVLVQVCCVVTASYMSTHTYHLYTNMHVLQTHIYMYLPACSHTYCTFTLQKHTYIHTHIHTHTRIRTHIHTHTHTQERDKALEEVSKHKKEAKTRAVRIEQLTSEVEQGRKEKGEISDQLKQMEAHRDHLLDKVSIYLKPLQWALCKGP